ncbi:MAG: hypothetical protein JO082_15970 [Mycobacterium sp.]|nr:hypothetical protein [Mycobacterium sp.]MBV9723400.1 hypothetical protein [Mycobacterium sp.]
MSGQKGHKAESDVEPEDHEARSRKGPDDGSYVGRTIGADDALDVGETGAEARSREK